MARRVMVITIVVLISLTRVAYADVILGAFDFNSALFGNTLLESDGGTHSSTDWLNTVNANPGNPAYLTGPNFETGIANIGLFGSVVAYTIGYNTPIANAAGNDLGVVVARYSSDPFNIEFSSDGGTTFSPVFLIPAATAVATGVGKGYFYGGNGPFPAELFVHPLDLTAFGFGPGATINAVRITGFTELDLIRSAGFGETTTVIPEPATLLLFGAGLGASAWRRRRHARRTRRAPARLRRA